MKNLNRVAIAVSAALLSSTALANPSVTDNWTVNGYGHLKYDVGESLDLQSTYEHRRDYRAAGAAFSGNPNQVEFTLKKADTYENGAYANYVIKTEYGNNEGSNGTVFYGSSGGNEGHLETGQLEFKEAYVELGNLSYFPEDMSIWAGRRYLNRQAGIITKEFWKQSSGVGGGVQYKSAGLAVVSADTGDGSANGINNRNGNVNADGTHTTLTSVDAYYYGVEALGGKFDFDAKFMTRANTDELNADAATDGLGLAITYSRDFYGFDGWTTTGVSYGKGIAGTKGVNFGSWSGGWNEGDTSIFVTSYGVANVTENLQVGTEFVYWGLSNSDDEKVWGTDDVTRIFFGVTPSYKVNDNFRMEAVLTYANEGLGKGSDWGREDDNTQFITATLAPVFTVNADYWGRPQIKPFITYMSSSDDNYSWSKSAKGSETRVGVEAEIWF